MDPSEEFDPVLLSDLLSVYYKRIFPVNLYFQWMSYGNINKNYFSNREFSFTLQDDIYLRYLSFTDQGEMEKEIFQKCPYKIDIGAVYSSKPREHRTSSSFQPVEKELVFDIDMTDYDDVRVCCSGTNICSNCWPFIIIAIKILNRALKEDFGYKHLLWVYSGRRGIHCWVADEGARKLSPVARSAVAEYLSVVKGGEFKAKKVHLGDNIHPSIEEACLIIEKHFDDLIIEKQGMLDSKENSQKILSLCQDTKIKEKLEGELTHYKTGKEKWNAIRNLMENFAEKKENRKNRHFVQEVMLQLCYPRLDINVTKGLNHLLKAPFCVHPKTGRVCVPIDARKIDDFNPFLVPTISHLCEEINAYDAQSKVADKETDVADTPEENSSINDSEANTGKKKIKDYKKTSLLESVKVFESFINDLKSSWKGKLLELSDKKKEF